MCVDTAQPNFKVNNNDNKSTAQIADSHIAKIENNSGLSLTLVYSSTNMSKSVWTSGFWKPLVHKNMSNFWNFILKILTNNFFKSQKRSFLVVKISLKTLPKKQEIAL